MLLEKDKLALNGGEKSIAHSIPFVGFGAEFVGQEEEDAVVDVIRTRKLCRITHPFAESYTNRFEEQVKERTGATYFHAINSCATALYAAMVALEIGPGDEVLVSGAGWFSIANAAINVGAVPVPVEFDESLTMDCDDLEAKITPRTRAVVVVHWRGMPSDMDRIMEIARRRNIRVIEDVAQSFGGTYKGQYLGTIGDVGCYSFNLHKVITCGEGGGVAVRDPELFKRVVSISGMYNFWRHYIKDGETSNVPRIPMLNFRLPEMCGAMAWAQMKKLDRVLDTLRARRDELLDGLQRIGGFQIAPRHDPAGEIGYTIPLVFDTAAKADFFCRALKAEGVPTVSTMGHAFSGGEGRGTGALVMSEGLDPSESGAMAFAHMWRPMIERVGTSDTLNPWRAHGDPLPVLPEGVIPKTLDRLSRVVTLKTNVLMTAEDTAAILRAVEKVVHASR